MLELLTCWSGTAAADPVLPHHCRQIVCISACAPVPEAASIDILSAGDLGGKQGLLMIKGFEIWVWGGGGSGED